VPYLVAYIATAVAFLAIDFVWLGYVVKDFYAREMGSLLRASPDFSIAAVFYLGYIVGIVFFAVAPALAAQSWKVALLNGALLGLLAYGTYDLTNLATLEGWPWRMALVDMTWGAGLTGVAAIAGYVAARAVA
jgi:uncharacterized membrane protein